MQPIKHPSAFIPVELANAIRNLSAIAEKCGRLQKDQLAIIYKNRWFNLFVPKEYGGLELTLLQGLQIEEGLAWTDGSTGWTVTLCSGANWFAGFLQQDAAKVIFKDDKVCLSGSGRPSGIAKVIGSGYEITGYWDYATGAPHATIFTANCIIEKDGTQVNNTEGNPVIRSFWFKKAEVTVDKKWNTLGMIATASESFEVKKLIVKNDRCFIIDSAYATLPQLIYQYPFLQFAEATLAVNSSGMAVRFFDLCETLFAAREENKYHNTESFKMLNKKLTHAKSSLQTLRTQFYLVIENSWTEMELNKAVPQKLLDQISNISRTLAVEARKLTDELYPYCGLSAANPAYEINRVWRNIHTASQHSLLNFPVTG